MKPLKYLYTNMANVPKELHNIPSFIQWRPQLNEKQNKWLKIPNQKTNEPSQHLTLPLSLVNFPRAGMVMNSTHPYIAIDVDDVSSMHPQLAPLISEHPTYIEYSPTGTDERFRIIYKLPTKEDKSKLTRRHAISLGQGEIELYNCSENYVTITGEIYPVIGEQANISTITAEELIKYFPEFKTSSTPTTLEFPKEPPPTFLPTLTKPELWIQIVECNRDHIQVKSLCEIKGWTYYEFWLYGCMSIHAAWGPAGFGIADAWSRKSSEYNKAELTYKWGTFSTDPEAHQITAATYELYFKHFSIPWPFKHATGSLIHDEFGNFKAFLDYLHLEICVDAITMTLFLKGPDAILYPYFYKTREDQYSIKDTDIDRLASKLLTYCRDYKFRPTINAVKSHLAVLFHQAPKINRFAEEISKHVWDGIDRIKILATTVIQKDPKFDNPTQEYHELFIRKWLYSLARYFWPNEINPQHLYATAEGMLILSGAQHGINKSSFGQRLFPKEWQHLYIQAKPRLSGYNEDKDYKMKTCTKVLVDYDEAERVLNGNDEADLKSYLTAAYDTFRVPYGTAPITVKRQHSVLATTNETNLPIPREGARRCWWLNVKYVDTYLLDTIDLWQLWAQIKKEVCELSLANKIAPWLLTPSERDYLSSYLLPHRTTNSLEEILLETYMFDEEGYNTKIKMAEEMNWTAKQATITKSEIAQKLRVQLNKALIRALDSVCKQYAPPPFRIQRTVIEQGKYYVSKQQRYFMPVERTEF